MEHAVKQPFLPAKFRHKAAGERALAALFQSCTARTAGFNTVDTAALTDGGKLLTMLLMFIGGSPGSTAGGVKTTTLTVLLVYAISSIRHEQDAHIFGRSLTGELLRNEPMPIIKKDFIFSPHPTVSRSAGKRTGGLAFFSKAFCRKWGQTVC